MKIKANKIRLQYDENRKIEVVLSTNENVQAEVEGLKNIVTKGKELTVEVKQYRKHRSMDSNAYMWVLLSKMADVMKTTKDELYLQILERYGVFTHVVVKPNVVGRVKAEWKTVRELGKVIINGQEGVQIQCFFGSSTYDSKEMSVLLEGVVSECKELDIQTITPRELEIMNQAWGR
ncbi:hypothetical protein KTC96_24870 (plasmid) [Clostridium estertheticum]|uniref:hypothetical protein n=1 Tax=Clostridium estertheticum TaxID=238834 RepID=UPI001C7DCBEF|nr:hypothetical protein [Clostridium estertheticum]MBX4259762.1 hypothetical protein [Clostridium estertheticum]WLC73256.1 hypothetical protein KTC96_24870 [Clostridium estertheticum]